MAKLSVVINNLNEKDNLKKAIASVKKLADEIVVIDMGSSDGSAEIAQKSGAIVYPHKRLDYVEPARNFGIEKANGPWILILDPDERISPKLQENIRQIIAKSEADYYRLPRKNIVFGKWLEYSRWWPDYNIRLFKKGAVLWNEIIHGVPLTHGRGLDLEAKEDMAIIHRHYDSIEQYVERMNRYTTVQARLLHKQEKKFSWQALIEKPSAEFLSRYFYGQGYKDGVHGLGVSLLQAVSELVVYLKLWQMAEFPQKTIKVADSINAFKHNEKSFHYWYNNTLVEEYGGVINRIKRKLKI